MLVGTSTANPPATSVTATKIAPVTVIKAPVNVALLFLGFSTYPGVLTAICAPGMIFPIVPRVSVGKALTGKGGVPGGQDRMSPCAIECTSLGSSGVSKGAGNGFAPSASRM